MHLFASALLCRARCASGVLSRACRRGGDLSWLEADAEALPVADSAVDSYTIAFGLRNVTRPEIALREATRVLRRGGRLLVLEFSQVEVEPLRSLYDTYSFSAIPAIGKLVVRRPATLRGVVSCSRLRTALLYAPARRATPPPTSTWWRASDSFRPKRSWRI